MENIITEPLQNSKVKAIGKVDAAKNFSPIYYQSPGKLIDSDSNPSCFNTSN